MIPLLFVLLASSVTHAAPRVNNGGGIWVCEAGGETQWIQAADFFEPTSYGQTRERGIIPHLNAQEIFAQKIAFIEAQVPELQSLLQKWPVDFDAVTKWVDFPLSPTLDMNFQTRPQPSTCPEGSIHYEQLADFLYDNSLLISRPLWSHPKLLPLDQAAILLHEWIYKALREDRDEQTSNRTRSIVAWLLSSSSPATIAKEIESLLRFSSHDQLEGEIATFPVAPRCEILVDSLVEGSWQSSAQQFGELVSLEAKGYRFEGKMSEKDGVPEDIVLFSPWGSLSLGKGLARSSYLRLKRVSLSFTPKSSRQPSAEVRCWNQI